MGNRFHAHLAGRIATTPTLDMTHDGKPWARFRMAVADRARSEATGEWENTQTVFHDVVAFGAIAERAVLVLRKGDPVIAHGEFRFSTYEDRDGNTRTGTSFVASRLAPDILLVDVTVSRDQRRAPAADRTRGKEPARTSPHSSAAQGDGDIVPPLVDGATTAPKGPGLQTPSSRFGHDPGR